MVANLETGGQQRMALLLAKELRNTYNVYFLVFTNEYQYGHYEFPESVEIINLNFKRGTRKLQKVIQVIKRAKVVKRVKKEKKIQYSISFGESANIVNCISRGREKVVTSVRGSLVLQTGARVIDKMMMHQSDRIIFISHVQRDAYAEFFPHYRDRMSVIYNACEMDYIEELSAQEPEELIDELTFTAVGRLVNVKCFRNLINAFLLVVKEYPRAKLIIIGGGELKEKLEKYINNLNARNIVKLVGNKENPFSYVARSRALLNSSGRESFSNVVLEGLACGVPVVACDCRFGPREILSGDDQYGVCGHYEICENGVLTPAFLLTGEDQPETERIFADAILRFLKDSNLEKKLREDAKERCKKFSVESYVEEWTELLQQL